MGGRGKKRGGGAAYEPHHAREILGEHTTRRARAYSRADGCYPSPTLPKENIKIQFKNAIIIQSQLPHTVHLYSPAHVYNL